jgi:hypothetical protein
MVHRRAGLVLFCLALTLFLLSGWAAPDFALAQSGGSCEPNGQCDGCSQNCQLNISGTGCTGNLCKNGPTCSTCVCNKYASSCCCY